MRRSRNFVRVGVCVCVCVCVGGGGGSRPDCQKTTLTTFFSPQLILQFYSGISKKTLIFQGFRGVNIFKGWGGGRSQPGWGIEMLISVEIHRTCDFAGWGLPPPPAHQGRQCNLHLLPLIHLTR